MNAFDLLSLDEEVPCQDLCDKIDALTRFQPSQRLLSLGDLGFFTVAPEYFFPSCVEFARLMLYEVVNDSFDNGTKSGEFEVSELFRCMGMLYAGDSAWLREWLVNAREFFVGNADVMDFSQPEIMNSSVPLICRRGVYSEMAFIYKAMLSTKMVWLVLVQEQPAINNLLSSNILSLMEFVEVTDELLQELRDYVPGILDEIKESRVIEVERDDEQSEGVVGSKSLENAEMVMVMYFILRESNVNQCDMTAVARLLVALSGRGYDNLYKKIRDPFQGKKRLVQRRMTRIKPFLEDLQSDSIMLRFNKKMQELKI